MKPTLIRAQQRGIPGVLHIETRRFYPLIAGGAPTTVELRQRLIDTTTRMSEAYDALAAADPAGDGVDMDALQRAFDEAEEAHSAAKRDLKRAENVAEARANAPVSAEDPEHRGHGGGSPRVTITREPRTYERHERNSYFLDLARLQLGRGDVEGAKRRLDQHEKDIKDELEKRELVAGQRLDRELEAMVSELHPAIQRALESRGVLDRLVEHRALSRTDGSGGHFVPPLWLLDEYAALQRAGRPFVEACRQIALPAGTDTINIPRITTGTLTATQQDGGAVSSQDMVDALVSCPVITIAGQEDVALQLLEQSPIAFDQIVFEDLIRDYQLRCDVQALNGSGSAGQVLGILNVSGVNAITYTDASPTVPELYPKIADGLNQAEQNRKAPITHGWMAPRRFWWSTAALDAQSRPFVVPQIQGPMNAAGVASLGGDTIEDQVLQMLGTFRKDHSIPVNLGAGTNEDRVIMTRNSDHLWFEGTLRARAMPEVLSNTLQVRLQVYSYAAFTAGRFPAGTSVIAGTGLITPTF